MRTLSVSLVVAVLLGPVGVSAAPKNPAFAFGKAKELEKVKAAEWAASAKAGLLVASGNTRLFTFNGGAGLSRRDKNNKFEFNLAGTVSRASVRVANDVDGNGTIDHLGEISRKEQLVSEAWGSKARYDRFVTTHNSVYVAGLAGADVPAGRDFTGGGQLGYSRELFKSKTTLVRAEAGYDFTYEDFVASDGVSIHSTRLFVAYEGKFNDKVDIKASTEALINLNIVETVVGKAGLGEDLRVATAAAITTKLFTNLSFQTQLSVKYDHFPAPLASLTIPFAMDFAPAANTVDTQLGATLIYNFF